MSCLPLQQSQSLQQSLPLSEVETFVAVVSPFFIGHESPQQSQQSLAASRTETIDAAASPFFIGHESPQQDLPACSEPSCFAFIGQELWSLQHVALTAVTAVVCA